MTWLRRLWDRAFLDHVDARPLAAMRICVGLVAAYVFLARLPTAARSFSDAGWLPSEIARQMITPPPWSWFFTITSPGGATALLVAGMLTSILLALGLGSRLSAWATFVLLVSMHNRNPVLVFGGDAVVRLFVLYVAVGRCDAAWSIDAVLRQRRTALDQLGAGNLDDRSLRGPITTRVTVPVWPVRLAQIQLALIYFTTGLAKLYGATWHSGQAMWYALVNPVFSRFNPAGAPLASFLRAPLRWLSYLVLGWELLFPALLVTRRSRVAALWLGVGFHLGIMLLLTVQWFGYAMLAAYFAFVPGRRLRALELEIMRRLRRRLRSHAPTVHYDGSDPVDRRRVATLAATDWLRLVKLVPGSAFRVVDASGATQTGRAGFRAVASVVPVLAPIAAVMLIPGLGWALERVFRTKTQGSG